MINFVMKINETPLSELAICQNFRKLSLPACVDLFGPFFRDVWRKLLALQRSICGTHAKYRPQNILLYTQIRKSVLQMYKS